jgi:hypothetical protein
MRAAVLLVALESSSVVVSFESIRRNDTGTVVDENVVLDGIDDPSVYRNLLQSDIHAILLSPKNKRKRKKK